MAEIKQECRKQIMPLLLQELSRQIEKFMLKIDKHQEYQKKVDNFLTEHNSLIKNLDSYLHFYFTKVFFNKIIKLH